MILRTRRIMLVLFLVITVIQVHFCYCDCLYYTSINGSDVRGSFGHFWRATGFCPPKPHNGSADFDLGSAMRQNLAYLGALPKMAIKQVRVHWLLDLISVDSMQTDKPQFNFTLLDMMVALMYENRLTLGFELMGNPSGIFDDFENKTQINWWRDLVALTAQRYVALYGAGYVRQWNFETWNEPDCHDFDHLKMTVQGYLNYYDACSEGLINVDKLLTFGGPGDGCGLYKAGKRTTYADALFGHVVNGRNYFSNKTGIRIDFISVHEKGDSKGLNILRKEIIAARMIEQLYPQLSNKSFYNDEADPLVGWSKPKPWRADAVYAGIVAKVIAQHQNILLGLPNPVIRSYSLLSNDNAFLSYHPYQFTQRTLLARFQMNSSSPHYVTFIRKPVYLVMGMLAKLGEEQVHINVYDQTGIPVSNSSNFGALATLHRHAKRKSSDSWQMTVLIYSASDPSEIGKSAKVQLDWHVALPEGTKDMKLMILRCNNRISNPYAVWTKLYNKTNFPTLKQFSVIRKHEYPDSQLTDISVRQGKMSLPFEIQTLDPQVTVLHLCARSELPPEQVTGLRFLNITRGQLLIIWSDHQIFTKCVQTYQVELSATGPLGPFKRIDTYNSTVTLFLFETDSDRKVRGSYRVRAIDYWGRPGEYSQVLMYS